MAVYADVLDEKLQSHVSWLNLFFEVNLGGDAEKNFLFYAIMEAGDAFAESYEDYPYTATEEDLLLHLNEEYTADMAEFVLNAFRAPEYADHVLYDAAAKTYTFYGLGGAGGMIPIRDYVGYEETENGYYVYFADRDIAYLYDYLYYGEITQEEYDAAILAGEWNGFRLESAMGEYYFIREVLKSGVRYAVAFEDGKGKYFELPKYYEEQDLPSEFGKLEEASAKLPVAEKTEVSVQLEVKDAFDEGTEVLVETVKEGEIFSAAKKAMEQQTAKQYQVFEFTAKDATGAVAQPKEKLEVFFGLPDGFSLNIDAYYLSPEGELEELVSTVDEEHRFVKVELTHFSTYIIADKGEQKPAAPQTADGTVVWGFVALAAAALASAACAVTAKPKKRTK